MAQGTLWSSYVIDTSSLVDVKYESHPDRVWVGLFELISAGRLKTVGFVYPELDRMEATQKMSVAEVQKLTEIKRQFVIPDDQIIHEAGRINMLYPKLGDVYDPRNRADPWVVAAAAVQGLIVVTEEADTGPRKTHKIPWVCDQENIKWIRLSSLVEHENLINLDA